MIELIAQTWQNARKQHQCDHCMKPIAIGTRYHRVRGVWEGDPGVFRSHVECAEVADKMHRNHGLCSDEGILLSSDVEAEDAAWIKVEYPVVAERLGL